MVGIGPGRGDPPGAKEGIGIPGLWPCTSPLNPPDPTRGRREPDPELEAVTGDPRTGDR